MGDAMLALDVPTTCLVAPRSRAEDALLRLVRRLGDAEPSAPSHARLVDALSADAARLLGLPSAAQRALRLGAFLHDVGKIAVPRAILRKPGPLTSSEWRAMRRHPAAGVRLLADIVKDEAALAVVHAHHERWDGSGYPRRLSGAAIPLGARIVAVADAFHAMVEARPYRRPLPPAEALGELRANAGRQFDPVCVEAVCAALSAPGTRPT
jgi:two-component system cell cycle response regulator